MLPPKNQKLFTVGRRCGRLANRLILFANFIALAEEQGHRLINFTFHSYAGLFEATRRNIYCRYPVPKRRSWMDVVPGVAAGIRKTRVLYHLTRYTSLLNERFPIFGNAAITLRELEGHPITFWTARSFKKKFARPKLFSCMTGVFVRPTWCGSTGTKSGPIFDRLKSTNRPAARRWNACGKKRMLLSGFTSGWETIGNGAGADITFRFRNMSFGCVNWQAGFRNARCPSWFAAMNPGTRPSSPDCPWVWARALPWATSTRWRGVTISWVLRALIRNGRRSTAKSRCCTSATPTIRSWWKNSASLIWTGIDRGKMNHNFRMPAD